MIFRILVVLCINVLFCSPTLAFFNKGDAVEQEIIGNNYEQAKKLVDEMGRKKHRDWYKYKNVLSIIKVHDNYLEMGRKFEINNSKVYLMTTRQAYKKYIKQLKDNSKHVNSSKTLNEYFKNQSKDATYLVNSYGELYRKKISEEIEQNKLKKEKSLAELEERRRVKKESEIKKAELDVIRRQEIQRNKKKSKDKITQKKKTKFRERKKAYVSIGVSYAEAVSVLGEVLNVKEAHGVDGFKKYIGSMPDRSVTLEIIGEKSNIAQATLLMVLPSDSPSTIQRNSEILLVFMNNIIPEWKGGAKWVVSALHSAKLTGDDKTQTIGDKLIRVSVAESMGGLIMIVIKNKNSK